MGEMDNLIHNPIFQETLFSFWDHFLSAAVHLRHSSMCHLKSNEQQSVQCSATESDLS